MTHDLIIVGAGPAGLATAIAAKQAGLDFRIFEKGVLVNALFRFPSQMVFFTTPDLLEIGGLPFVTPHGKPTRDEALRYYRRVVDTHEIDIAFGSTVTDVTPGGDDAPFTVGTRDARGVTHRWQSRCLVVANGCYDHPNRLRVPGEDLPHVSHYYTEPHEFYRKRVVVVGGKNSAAEAALDLYRAGASVAWCIGAPSSARPSNTGSNRTSRTGFGKGRSRRRSRRRSWRSGTEILWSTAPGRGRRWRRMPCFC